MGLLTYYSTLCVILFATVCLIVIQAGNLDGRCFAFMGLNGKCWSLDLISLLMAYGVVRQSIGC